MISRELIQYYLNLICKLHASEITHPYKVLFELLNTINTNESIVSAKLTTFFYSIKFYVSKNSRTSKVTTYSVVLKKFAELPIEQQDTLLRYFLETNIAIGIDYKEYERIYAIWVAFFLVYSDIADALIEIMRCSQNVEEMSLLKNTLLAARTWKQRIYFEELFSVIETQVFDPQDYWYIVLTLQTMHVPELCRSLVINKIKLLLELNKSSLECENASINLFAYAVLFRLKKNNFSNQYNFIQTLRLMLVYPHESNSESVPGQKVKFIKYNIAYKQSNFEWLINLCYALPAWVEKDECFRQQVCQTLVEQYEAVQSVPVKIAILYLLSKLQYDVIWLRTQLTMDLYLFRCGLEEKNQLRIFSRELLMYLDLTSTSVQLSLFDEYNKLFAEESELFQMGLMALSSVKHPSTELLTKMSGIIELADDPNMVTNRLAVIWIKMCFKGLNSEDIANDLNLSLKIIWTKYKKYCDHREVVSNRTTMRQMSLKLSDDGCEPEVRITMLENDIIGSLVILAKIINQLNVTLRSDVISRVLNKVDAILVSGKPTIYLALMQFLLDINLRNCTSIKTILNGLLVMNIVAEGQILKLCELFCRYEPSQVELNLILDKLFAYLTHASIKVQIAACKTITFYIHQCALSPENKTFLAEKLHAYEPTISDSAAISALTYNQWLAQLQQETNFKEQVFQPNRVPLDLQNMILRRFIY